MNRPKLPEGMYPEDAREDLERACAFFDDVEWQVLCGEIPMTQERYNSIMEHCIAAFCGPGYAEVLLGYPEFTDGYDRFLKETHGIDIPKEPTEEAFEELMEYIRLCEEEGINPG